MDLAILIAVHNRNDLRLKNCLRTLLAQNTSRDYGIYVVDYSSTDDLSAMLGGLSSDKFFYIHVPGQDVNKAHANNVGLQALDADIVAVTDGLCLFQNTLVETLCTKATNDTLLTRIRRPSYVPEYLWKDTALTPEDFENFRLQGAEWLEEELHVAPGIKRKRLFAAKRQRFFDIKGYDERLVYDEDVDIVRRLLQSGLTLEDVSDDIAMAFQPSLDDIPTKPIIGQLQREDIDLHEAFARYKKGPERNTNIDWGQV